MKLITCGAVLALATGASAGGLQDLYDARLTSQSNAGNTASVDAPARWIPKADGYTLTGPGTYSFGTLNSAYTPAGQTFLADFSNYQTESAERLWADEIYNLNIGDFKVILKDVLHDSFTKEQSSPGQSFPVAFNTVSSRADDEVKLEGLTTIIDTKDPTTVVRYASRVFRYFETLTTAQCPGTDCDAVRAGTAEQFEMCRATNGNVCFHVASGVCGDPCGNGLTEASEECDDGNNLNGDGCDEHCHIESGCATREVYHTV